MELSDGSLMDFLRQMFPETPLDELQRAVADCGNEASRVVNQLLAGEMSSSMDAETAPPVNDDIFGMLCAEFENADPAIVLAVLDECAGDGDGARQALHVMCGTRDAQEATDRALAEQLLAEERRATRRARRARARGGAMPAKPSRSWAAIAAPEGTPAMGSRVRSAPSRSGCAVDPVRQAGRAQAGPAQTGRAEPAAAVAREGRGELGGSGALWRAARDPSVWEGASVAGAADARAANAAAYKAEREDAARAFAARDKCFRDAARAFQRGEAGAAAGLAERGHAQAHAAAAKSDGAAARMFRRVNAGAGRGGYFIDLHGLHAREAATAVASRMDFLSAQPSLTDGRGRAREAELHVVTGRGGHSQGEAVLPRAVRSWANKEGHKWRALNAGAIGITVPARVAFAPRASSATVPLSAFVTAGSKPPPSASRGKRAGRARRKARPGTVQASYM